MKISIACRIAAASFHSLYCFGCIHSGYCSQHIAKCSLGVWSFIR